MCWDKCTAWTPELGRLLLWEGMLGSLGPGSEMPWRGVGIR